MSEPIDLDKQLAECGEKAGTGNLTYGQIQAVKSIIAQEVAKARDESFGYGFKLGWEARDSAVDTKGASKPSKAMKARLAELQKEIKDANR